jgi:hypothetical protein
MLRAAPHSYREQEPSWSHNPQTPKWLPWDNEPGSPKKTGRNVKKVTSKKSVWSPDDLQRYPAEADDASKVDRHWQQALAILANGSERGDSEPSEAIYPRTSSSEVTRRTQKLGRNHLMTTPRRCLSSSTEGKTIIPAKMVLQQIADILKTPAILVAGVISPGAPIPKTPPERPFQRLSRRSQRRRKEKATQAAQPKATTRTRNW